MKHFISISLLLAISTVAMANNSPAQRCKRYANANAFQTTVAQLCGKGLRSEYEDVLKAQSCSDALGKDNLKQQQDAEAAQLKAEHDRIGNQAFCAKYGNRR